MQLICLRVKQEDNQKILLSRDYVTCIPAFYIESTESVNK